MVQKKKKKKKKIYLYMYEYFYFYSGRKDSKGLERTRKERKGKEIRNPCSIFDAQGKVYFPVEIKKE